MWELYPEQEGTDVWLFQNREYTVQGRKETYVPATRNVIYKCIIIYEEGPEILVSRDNAYEILLDIPPSLWLYSRVSETREETFQRLTGNLPKDMDLSKHDIYITDRFEDLEID